MTTKRWLVALLVLPAVAACGSTPSTEVSAPTGVSAKSTGTAGTTLTVDLDDRPFRLHVPTSYVSGTRAPLVVLLHGFQASGAIQERYFRLTAESERRGFLYAMPDGTANREGKRFWNATGACCDFYGSGVDDSTYLRRLLDTVRSSYSVDPRRVYLIGHSNGGFMAYRMACEHATEITAIVSLAGAATRDASRCVPRRPVSVLQIHGTNDRTISFDGGGRANRAYPSVATTLATWRRLNGCAGRADRSAAPLDLDSGGPGAETSVTTYATGCRGGTRVELWSIKDGSHVPPFTAGFGPAVIDFLYAREAAT